MWKILYQLASPKTCYEWSERWVPWLSILAFLCLTTGLVWGLCFAPADVQQGEAFRIIYVHVPSAFLSMALYAWMGFLSFLLLIWRIKLAGIFLRQCAEVGASMAFLALVTGSIWGKPMWGTWWIWDARLTSELILLFFYGAILALGQAYQNKEQAYRMMSILTLVGLVDLPVIHYSVVWWNTLHQGSTLSLFAKPKIDRTMLYPLLISLCGFFLFSLVLILRKVQNELMLSERRQSWVKGMMGQSL